MAWAHNIPCKVVLTLCQVAEPVSQQAPIGPSSIAQEACVRLHGRALQAAHHTLLGDEGVLVYRYATHSAFPNVLAVYLEIILTITAGLAEIVLLCHQRVRSSSQAELASHRGWRRRRGFVQQRR